MKTQNVMVLLASLLPATTVFADVPASNATNRAKFASLHPVGEATIARLEKERGHKFSFEEVRTVATGTNWQTELSKTEKAYCAAGKPDEKLARLFQCPDK